MSDSIMDLPLFAVSQRSHVIESVVRNIDTEARHAREILQELQSGPLGTAEVESRWHRGQAAIGRLRDEGHVIDTISRQYVYRGFKPGRIKVTKELQNLYYQTPHWKERAASRKMLDGHKCTRCGCSGDLETHHWKYDLFNESMDDLQTYCSECHELMHERLKGSKVHFPRYIDSSVANRITSEAAS